MSTARAPRTAARLLLAASIAVGACSCGAVHTQYCYWSESNGLLVDIAVPSNVIYGGTTTDAILLGGCFYQAAQGSHLALAWLPFVVIDLPLTLAADTVLLPLTIGEQIELATRDRRRRFRGPPITEPPLPDPGPAGATQ